MIRLSLCQSVAPGPAAVVHRNFLVQPPPPPPPSASARFSSRDFSFPQLNGTGERVYGHAIELRTDNQVLHPHKRVTMVFATSRCYTPRRHDAGSSTRYCGAYPRKIVACIAFTTRTFTLDPSPVLPGI